MNNVLDTTRRNPVAATPTRLMLGLALAFFAVATPAISQQAPAPDGDGAPAATSGQEGAPAASRPPASTLPDAVPSSSSPDAAEPLPVQETGPLPDAADLQDPQLLDMGQTGEGILPHDLSPWGMFMAADWVVKAVMIGLAFASVVTWTVWLAKSAEIGAARRRLRQAMGEIAKAGSLADASARMRQQSGPGADLVHAAVEEVQASQDVIDHGGEQGLKERVGSRLTRIQAQAGRSLTRGTGLLATIGSTAPFVGLFGTVWGIMNSFIGISKAQTTNLAVVAPGIAEALLATALGLVAAIPAVVIYNTFARSVSGYRQALADAAAGVERLISRDLDVRRVKRTVAGISRARDSRPAAAE